MLLPMKGEEASMPVVKEEEMKEEVGTDDMKPYVSGKAAVKVKTESSNGPSNAKKVRHAVIMFTSFLLLSLSLFALTSF